jgi:hypothetical protein
MSDKLIDLFFFLTLLIDFFSDVRAKLHKMFDDGCVSRGHSCKECNTETVITSLVRSSFYFLSCFLFEVILIVSEVKITASCT